MLASSIYDHLIESVLKILSRLNLRSTKADDDDAVTKLTRSDDDVKLVGICLPDLFLFLDHWFHQLSSAATERELFC